MSVLPYNKAFSIVKGATFDYSWQYLTGTANNATPVDLSTYTGTWTLHTPGGNVTYSTGASAGTSGVFFGGPTNDRTNGIIDLVIDAADTTAITWSNISYTFFITNTGVTPSVVVPMLTGSINVVLTLP